ncbi:MAG TPA: Cys-tRNA(Pro) deacylase [Pyrinomonadaceae bacterium]|nr:Cys-tRNA(Pro) deacylase [Pyrinomonadaceae bacterium]
MDYPITPAVRLLREKKVEFEPHLYDYEEHGGTKHSAEELGVDEHTVVKTLVMEAEGKRPFLVLMHGDREVSTKQLARHMEVKAVHPCDFAEAQKHTGYLVGGTSPFGTRTHLHVYAERTIFELPKIYINGGKRGFLVSIDPKVLRDVLHAEEVEVAI